MDIGFLVVIMELTKGKLLLCIMLILSKLSDKRAIVLLHTENLQLFWPNWTGYLNCMLDKKLKCLKIIYTNIFCDRWIYKVCYAVKFVWSLLLYKRQIIIIIYIYIYILCKGNLIFCFPVIWENCFQMVG